MNRKQIVTTLRRNIDVYEEFLELEGDPKLIKNALLAMGELKDAKIVINKVIKKAGDKYTDYLLDPEIKPAYFDKRIKYLDKALEIAEAISEYDNADFNDLINEVDS